MPVQQQINDTFVQTIPRPLEAFQLVNNVADDTDDQTIADNLSAALAQISQTYPLPPALYRHFPIWQILRQLC